VILAQVSDPHIVPPGQLLGGEIDTAGYLRRCVARLEGVAPRPDAVLITRDLVDRGDEASYRALRDLLAPLAMPIYLELGNHGKRTSARSWIASRTHAWRTASGRESTRWALRTMSGGAARVRH
jgi:3',5'-cyclic AMP phosphodiesterase CpdA